MSSKLEVRDIMSYVFPLQSRMLTTADVPDFRQLRWCKWALPKSETGLGNTLRLAAVMPTRQASKQGDRSAQHMEESSGIASTWNLFGCQPEVRQNPPTSAACST